MKKPEWGRPCIGQALLRATPALRIVLPLALAVAAGLAWLAGGTSLAGPLASLLLPLATAISRSRCAAFAAALLYYGIGSVSIVGAIAGYYGAGHAVTGLLTWSGACAALALPWALGRSAWGRLFALVATAVPPLGVIGWLSPLNAAGVIFPQGWGWFAIAGTTAFIMGFPFISEYWKTDVPARKGGKTGIIIDSILVPLVPAWVWIRVIRERGDGRPFLSGERARENCRYAGYMFLVATLFWGILDGARALTDSGPPAPPAGWVGLQTRIAPAHGNVGAAIAAQQDLVGAALRMAPAAHVVVFPEAVLDNWLPGTQQQFATAVPPGQTWLVGAMTADHDAVVIARAAHADDRPATDAAGLLLAGDWRPWENRALRPAWWQRVFVVDGQRVWAALCVEQLQPWT